MSFKKQLLGVGLGAGSGAGLGSGVILCADAGFLANASKGMLAALRVATLSSCRRVRTCCKLFMCVAPKGWHRPAKALAHSRMARARTRLPYPRWTAVVISFLGQAGDEQVTRDRYHMKFRCAIY